MCLRIIHCANDHEQQVKLLHREKIIILVVELLPPDINKWRDIDNDVQALVAEYRAKHKHLQALCYRYYSWWSDNTDSGAGMGVDELEANDSTRATVRTLKNGTVVMNSDEMSEGGARVLPPPPETAREMAEPTSDGWLSRMDSGAATARPLTPTSHRSPMPAADDWPTPDERDDQYVPLRAPFRSSQNSFFGSSTRRSHRVRWSAEPPLHLPEPSLPGTRPTRPLTPPRTPPGPLARVLQEPSSRTTTVPATPRSMTPMPPADEVDALLSNWTRYGNGAGYTW